jgi:peptidoglycan/LPS O-acetylase OafA/YrhL
MKKWTMTTEVVKNIILLGLTMFLIGYIFNYPFEFDFTKVIMHISKMKYIIWLKILIVSFLCLGVAQLLKKKNIFFAQSISTIGFMFILSPFFLLLAGIPDSLGWKAAIINLSVLIILISGSNYIAIRIFKEQSKLSEV